MKRSAASVIVLAVVLGAAVFVSADEHQHHRKSSIPAGTPIEVRIVESLTSEKAQVGDAFHATLNEPLMVEGREMYAKGADVLGRVTEAHASGRLSDPGVLALEITEISYSGRTTPVHVEPFTLKGESHAKSNVTKIGGGAALGAVIGAIAGGGKGAAVGTVAGGAAGTGVAAATGKKEATIESEALLSFVVAEDASGAVEAQARESARDSGDPGPRQFSLRDQRLIRHCFSEHASDLPADQTRRGEMASDSQLQAGEILTPGVQKRVRPLPDVCENELPRLPRDLERVVYNRRVLLLDANSRILDSFDLDK
jgi:outer membrane lipoprotein SlyB